MQLIELPGSESPACPLYVEEIGYTVTTKNMIIENRKKSIALI